MTLFLSATGKTRVAVTSVARRSVQGLFASQRVAAPSYYFAAITPSLSLVTLKVIGSHLRRAEAEPHRRHRRATMFHLFPFYSRQ